MATPRNRQAIFELYARPWLTDMARWLGRPPTLAEVPVGELDRIAELGLGWIWLMGVWPSGPRGIEIARTLSDLRGEYRRALPDFTDADVGGSPYAVAAYAVDPRLGGPAALAVLRHRLATRGIRLMLDFVVNHTGIDHPWISERPDLYVAGSEEDLERSPHDFFAADTAAGRRILAHGRDPYFPGWTDTAQLNLLHPEARRRLAGVLTGIAEQCDGVRCDMAMLALGDVFRRTWGDRALAGVPSPPPGEELWPELIAAARARNPGFLLLAEAYWGAEHALQQQGFDLTYDKTLYERLRSGSGREVRDHLRADLGYQRRCLRFLENHDEARAAAVFPWDRHRAAAVVAATVPGALLIHNGQAEGNRVRLPVQLLRRPREETQPEVLTFYRALLAAAGEIAAVPAEWRLLEVGPAWEGNPTWDGFVSFAWAGDGDDASLAAVNFAPRQGQCYVALDGVPLGDGTIELRDRLSEARYQRPAGELASQGLYLDMPPFGAHLFALSRG